MYTRVRFRFVVLTINVGVRLKKKIDLHTAFRQFERDLREIIDKYHMVRGLRFIYAYIFLKRSERMTCENDRLSDDFIFSRTTCHA